jgi:hypothetical protein
VLAPDVRLVLPAHAGRGEGVPDGACPAGKRSKECRTSERQCGARAEQKAIIFYNRCLQEVLNVGTIFLASYQTEKLVIFTICNNSKIHVLL